jgi:hypothetical protein
MSPVLYLTILIKVGRARDREDESKCRRRRGRTEREGTYPKPVCFLTPAKTVEIARASKA